MKFYTALQILFGVVLVVIIAVGFLAAQEHKEETKSLLVAPQSNSSGTTKFNF